MQIYAFQRYLDKVQITHLRVVLLFSLPTEVGAPSWRSLWNLLGAHASACLGAHTSVCIFADESWRSQSAFLCHWYQRYWQCATGGFGMGLNDALRGVVLSLFDLRSMPRMIPLSLLHGVVLSLLDRFQMVAGGSVDDAKSCLLNTLPQRICCCVVFLLPRCPPLLR